MVAYVCPPSILTKQVSCWLGVAVTLSYDHVFYGGITFVACMNFSGYSVAEVPSGQRHWAWGPCEMAKPDCNTFCIKLGINPRFGGYCKVNEVGINMCYCRV